LGGVYPPPCFWQKRLQALENKGSECEKERQERIRGGSPLKIKELAGLSVGKFEPGGNRNPHPPFRIDVKGKGLL
jgi:hypothetical protein